MLSRFVINTVTQSAVSQSVTWSVSHCTRLLEGLRAVSQLTFESNLVIALVLLHILLLLVSKTCTSFSTNEKGNQNQSCLAPTRFPALVSSSDWFFALSAPLTIGQLLLCSYSSFYDTQMNN